MTYNSHDKQNGTVEATRKMFSRYLEIICNVYVPEKDEFADTRMSYLNLKWMCETALDPEITMPIDKMSRWLGFVQGCLAMRGDIDVDKEREYSRPLFQSAWKKQGVTSVTRERDTER